MLCLPLSLLYAALGWWRQRSELLQQPFLPGVIHLDNAIGRAHTFLTTKFLSYEAGNMKISMVQRPRSGLPVHLWFTAILAASSSATPILFERDLSQLLDSTLTGVSSRIKDLFKVGTSLPTSIGKQRCKVYPGDANWPCDLAWETLNKLTDNRLLQPSPQASACYNGPLYDGAKCQEMTATWNRSYSHFIDPIEMMSPVAQGLTCLPPNVFDSGNCTRGGFPMYVINATEPKHVQMGVNFARNSGVRLVVKNTGHDFLGKSGGKDALSIWTHHFKAIDYIEEFKDEKLGYSGPAFKAGVGVQAFEIYKFAHSKGHSVVGGEGETVGIFGGYIQGGGHSPLSSL